MNDYDDDYDDDLVIILHFTKFYLSYLFNILNYNI